MSGAYSVEAGVRRNDGSRADTGFFPKTGAVGALFFDEFESRRESFIGP